MNHANDLVKAQKVSSPSSSMALARSYLASLQSERSRDTTIDSFRRVAKVLELGDPEKIPWGPAFTPDLLRLLKRKLLGGRYAPATVNLTLQAVKGVFRTAYEDGHLPEDLWHRVQRPLKGVSGTRHTKGRVLTKEEVKTVLLALEPYEETKGALLRAIVLLAIGTGIRRTELCSLELRGLRDGALYVVGKGDRENRSPLDASTQAELARWLAVRKTLRWNHGLVFGAPKRGTRLSPDLLSRMILRLSRDARVKPFAPHDLRRTFAARMLDGGLDLTQVQRLLHHSKIATTALYDKRSEASLDEARRRVKVT